MNITEAAQKRIYTILEYYFADVFRVEIQGGGCNGFKYNFDISKPQEDDIYIGEGLIRKRVVVDPMSMMYLEGSTLDFKDTIFSQSFVIDNPNMKTTCGCGESIGF